MSAAGVLAVNGWVNNRVKSDAQRVRKSSVTFAPCLHFAQELRVFGEYAVLPASLPKWTRYRPTHRPRCRNHSDRRASAIVILQPQTPHGFLAVQRIENPMRITPAGIPGSATNRRSTSSDRWLRRRELPRRHHSAKAGQRH